MAIIQAKPLWDRFDSPMRSALQYMARERAMRRAAKELKGEGRKDKQ